jgi:tetratricopeptide (TPR) repeat protein
LSTAVSIYFLKGIISNDLFSNLNIYIYNRYLATLMIILPAYFSGVLNSYFLNISTGDFLDEKNLLSNYMISLLLSISSGLFIASHGFFNYFYVNKIIPYFSLLTVLLFFIMIFINKKFNPEPLFAKQYLDDVIIEPEQQVQRDDLFYTYLNFTYIITYIFLGYLVLIKFYGNIYFHGQIYVSVVFFSMAAGYLAGKLKKPSFWYVYSEMLFPVIFLTYLFLLFSFSDKISLGIAYTIAAAPSAIYGFSLRQTFENILTKYDHNKRYNIINFSLYILPIPIILSISFLNYTNILFYIILYIIGILNILIPGIFLFNLKINPLKKFAYFVFTLIFITAVLMLHLYFKIPLTAKPFFTRSENFELLQKTNFNLPYITEKGTITIYGTPAFYLSDSNIRNLKRVAAAAALYAKENTSTLVIDSNQKFFRNPVYSLMPDLTCVDTLPAKHIDNNRLPFSGNQLYNPLQKELLNYLLDNKKLFHLIVDSPNIPDQTIHSFKSSPEYYDLIKKQTPEDGVYAVIFDMKFAGDETLKSSLEQLNVKFKFHTVYLFSDIILILASDSQESLKLTPDSFKRITPLYSENSESGKIFYNDIHCLNNILYSSLEPLINNLSQTQRPVSENGLRLLPPELLDYYLKYSPDWFKNSISDADARFYSDIKSQVQRNSKVFSILKNLEYAESVNEYNKEIQNLFELKKYAPYNDSIKDYVNSQLSYKDKYYQSEALRLEKNKKWDEAARLYQAILTIDTDNFDGNYKLGLLYITLQDMNNAFTYLDKALKLQKDNPQVLYQMGTLMFFNDKFKEAINYLEQANKLNINTSLLYMYLGISYEKTGKNEDARLNYEKAIQQDPNDKKLQLLLENLNVKMNTLPFSSQEGQKTNMIDDEQDENITIPVNKKAIKARIKDDE